MDNDTSLTGQPAIRQMAARDLPAVQMLLNQLGYHLSADETRRRFETTADAPGHVLLVATSDRQVVGLLHAFARPALEKPPEAVVQALVVDRSRRQAGIGSRLMAEAERWAVAQGFSSMVLATQVAREGAQAFYRRLGYETFATSHAMRKWIVL